MGDVTPALCLLLVAAQAAAPGAPGTKAEDPAAIAARAVALQKEGKLESAAAEYRRFLEIVPRSWEARSNLGVVCAQLVRFEEAVT